MVRSATAVVLVMLSGLAAWCQLPPPPSPEPLIVPIDGGVVLLAAAGAAYGAKKVYGKRKKGN